MRVREEPDQWKQIQKIIHSFQSLLVIEPKSLTYSLTNQPLNDFMRFLIAFRTHQHSLIQKASEQTLASFIKNEFTPKVIGKLESPIVQELSVMADKMGVVLVTREAENARRESGVSRGESGIGRRERVEKVNELDQMLLGMRGESDWKVQFVCMQIKS